MQRLCTVQYDISVLTKDVDIIYTGAGHGSEALNGRAESLFQSLVVAEMLRWSGIRSNILLKRKE
jgi:hypothetical protein